MKLLAALAGTPGAKALGWALFHFLWEGAAIALALAIGLWLLRKSQARYAAACIAMLAMVAAFAVTGALVFPRNEAIAVKNAAARPVAPARLGQLPEPAPAGPVKADPLPWIAPFWGLGVLLFQMRSVAGWVQARRLAQTGVCAAPEEWRARLDRLRVRLQISKPVALLESCLADTPVVVGYLRPAILVPAGMLTGLPVALLEAILIHELAHIRRRDYPVNLLQTFVEGLLFYHPAVWWVSSVIRAERENCCDDLAAALSGGAHEYAAALAALEETRTASYQAALAANGGNLVKRIRRLLYPESPRAVLTPALSAALLTTAIAVTAAAWQGKPNETPQPHAMRPAVEAPAFVAAHEDSPAPVAKKAPVLLAQVSNTPPFAKPQTPLPEQNLGHQLQKEIAQMAATLYQKWMREDVAYIVTDQERTAFKLLQTDVDRETFITQFWARRNPVPGSAENAYKEEHYRRIAYANEHFGSAIAGWKTDRGRIYITFGPPDEIEDHPAGGAYTRPAEQGGAMTTTVPFQQWRYKYIEGVGTNVIVEFVDSARSGEYRMTMDPSEKEVVRKARLQLPPGPVEGTLTFTSVGPGPLIKVDSQPGGKVIVTLQNAGLPGKFDFAGQVKSGTGATVANVRDQLTLSAEADPGRTFTYETAFTLTPGSYTLDFVVRDPKGAMQTKVVDFYVNPKK